MIGIELLGTIAFAISGVVVAIERKMDLFGVLFLGVTTACGGGLLRDLVLGVHPPMMFQNPLYVFVAALTSFFLFVYAYFSKNFDRYIHKFDMILNISDAIGLGAFVVVGVESALALEHSQFAFLCIFSGFLTGAGGGILRDVLAGQIPAVFYKRIYAVAALLGAFIYYQLIQVLPFEIVAPFTVLCITWIRIEASRKLWRLPRIVREEDEVH